MKKVSLLTRPAQARRDAPCPRQRSRIARRLNLRNGVRFASSLAAALPDVLFEQPVRRGSLYGGHSDYLKCLYDSTTARGMHDVSSRSANCASSADNFPIRCPRAAGQGKRRVRVTVERGMSRSCQITIISLPPVPSRSASFVALLGRDKPIRVVLEGLLQTDGFERGPAEASLAVEQSGILRDSTKQIAELQIRSLFAHVLSRYREHSLACTDNLEGRAG